MKKTTLWVQPRLNINLPGDYWFLQYRTYNQRSKLAVAKTIGQIVQILKKNTDLDAKIEGLYYGYFCQPSYNFAVKTYCDRLDSYVSITQQVAGDHVKTLVKAGQPLPVQFQECDSYVYNGDLGNLDSVDLDPGYEFSYINLHTNCTNCGGSKMLGIDWVEAAKLVYPEVFVDKPTNYIPAGSYPLRYWVPGLGVQNQDCIPDLNDDPAFFFCGKEESLLFNDKILDFLEWQNKAKAKQEAHSEAKVKARWEHHAKQNLEQAHNFLVKLPYLK